MDTQRPSSPWILEDDLRLINAIEAGASLESLAKGAVTFSRKFTLKELRDRWHSLLYDPKVSSEAASRLSGHHFSSIPSHALEKTSFPPTGNTERVRSLYSAARKRLRMEQVNSTEDLNYVADPSNANNMGNAEDHLFGQDMLDDDILNNLNFDESFMEIINNVFPDVLEDIQQDISMDIFPTGCSNNADGIDLPQNPSFFGNQPSQISEIEEHIGNACSSLRDDKVFVSLVPLPGPSQALDDQHHSPSVFNIAAKETRDCNDKNITEASECIQQSIEPEDTTSDMEQYIDELTKSLLNEEDLLRDKDGNQQNTTSNTHHADIFVTLECRRDACDDAIFLEANGNNASCISVPSTTRLVCDPRPEYRDGVIICTLNCVSDEIPDNDHIPSEPQNLKSRKSPHTAAREVLTNKKFGKPPLPPKIIKSRARNTNDPKLSVGSRSKESIAACKSADFTSSTFNDKVIGMEKSSVASFPCLNDLQDKTFDDKLEKDILQDLQSQNADMDMNASTMEPENDLIESDEDLPSFSDIETMILDMDLTPAGQDLYQLEVAKYQHEDVKRTIVRLEQSARSYMQRDLASHGALAILYGEQSRYYIKQSEVLIGRSTGEYPIDIDLGRSGTKTSVSRRQALISLQNDGSFYIKNLGKFTMCVNGEEFEYGQVLKLKNNSLIEIRGMAFIFETSATCVKRYLDSIRLDQPKQNNLMNP